MTCRCMHAFSFIVFSVACLQLHDQTAMCCSHCTCAAHHCICHTCNCRPGYARTISHMVHASVMVCQCCCYIAAHMHVATHIAQVSCYSTVNTPHPRAYVLMRMIYGCIGLYIRRSRTCSIMGVPTGVCCVGPGCRASAAQRLQSLDRETFLQRTCVVRCCRRKCLHMICKVNMWTNMHALDLASNLEAAPNEP